MSETQATYTAFVRKLFNRSGDPSKDFTHAILGIVTEIHEYLSATDAVNGLEELGDLEFYHEALDQVIFDFTGEHYRVDAYDHLFDGPSLLHASAAEHGIAYVISDMTNRLLDQSKRWVGYNKEPKSLREVMLDVTDLLTFVNTTGPYPEMNGKRRQASNMAKLLKRYPGGDYDQFRALNRDLESERNALASS